MTKFNIIKVLHSQYKYLSKFLKVNPSLQNKYHIKLDMNRNENYVFHKPIHLYEPLYISYWTHDRWAEKTLLKNLIIITLFCWCQDIEGNVRRGSFNGLFLNVIVGNIFRTLIRGMHFMFCSLINECQFDEEQAINSRVEYCYGLISIKLCFSK